MRPLYKSNIQVRLSMTSEYPLYPQRRELITLIRSPNEASSGICIVYIPLSASSPMQTERLPNFIVIIVLFVCISGIYVDDLPAIRTCGFKFLIGIVVDLFAAFRTYLI